MTLHVDQEYRNVGGIALGYDFFRPDTDDALPLLILIHGGGWISGEKEDMRPLGSAFVQHGFAVGIPTYRLAPLHPFPAAIDDVRSFIRFARSQADSWGIDPEKIGVIGNSAGGHLAALAGLSPEAAERANAVVDVCGITDLTDSRENHPNVSWGFIDQFLPYSPEESSAIFNAASPIFQIFPGAPPFFIVHGDADEIVPVDQSDRFAKKLKDFGIDTTYWRVENEDHSFSGGSWPLIVDESATFFRERL